MNKTKLWKLAAILTICGTAALVVFTVLGYYTGKHHLDDDLVFL